MSLRTKVMLALVALATLTAAVLGWFAYSSTRNQLDRQTDQSLAEAASYVGQSRGPDGNRGNDPHTSVDLQVVAVQELDPTGAVEPGGTGVPAPVTAVDIAIANGSSTRSVYRTVRVDSTSYRMLTVPEDHGGAFQLLRPLTDRNAVLASLRWRILIAAGLTIAAGAGSGWFIAGRLTRRLRDLARAAQEVEQTGRLDLPIPAVSRDETGQLSVALRRMLESLQQAQLAQRRLIQDAGHELRTPLTSLRTNVEVLQRYPSLTSAQRETVLSDLQTETRELTELCNELIALGLGANDQSRPAEPVSLGAVAERAVGRARRRFDRDIALSSDAGVVRAQTTELERAIGNLLENAVKFSPAGTTITVTVDAGRLRVEDRGAGVHPEDRVRIFDRFYRSASARALPGSGLGLAIVDDIVRRAGGQVELDTGPDGSGISIGFQLPLPAELQPCSNPGPVTR